MKGGNESCRLLLFHPVTRDHLLVSTMDELIVDGSETFDKLSDMQTNVSTLLREFPRIRQAAMRGERVIIQTREGNLILEAEEQKKIGVLGSMKEFIQFSENDLDQPTTIDGDWRPSL